MTDLVNCGIKVAKMATSIIISAVIVEGSYVASSVLADDVEYVGKEIDKKINPIEMRKEHWYSKKKPFNTRTGKFVLK